jgi:maleylpyruvate isomerase
VAPAPDPADEAQQLEADLVGARSAHQRLRTTLDRLDDAAVRQPSRLPGWTVGHVLSHLARNAESHVRILEGALVGEHLEQYAGGVSQRSADIGAGAGRSASALVEDVLRSAARLEDLWAAVTPEAWAGHGLAGGAIWPCRDLPFHRWREVEVHHVDMGVGYEINDWPEEYVAAELTRSLAALPDRLPDDEARRRLLAWLLGRTDSPGDLTIEPWQSRREHYHRRGR